MAHSVVLPMPGQTDSAKQKQHLRHASMQVMRVLQQQQILDAADGIGSLFEVLNSSPGLVLPSSPLTSALLLQKFVTRSLLPFCTFYVRKNMFIPVA